ncbi:Hypothetical predicted protein [Paramuricea clavata]|uniref:Uncharacterized protein n=1 Tax=Paramuricea clavata TaxID=317549 RepID=A0A6S7FYG5_PARCT|nr:Hypothetical predicted protein [Paramuricea clavata]
MIFSFFISQTAPRIPSLFLLDYLTEDAPDGEDMEPPPRRYSTTQEQEVLDEKIRKFQRSSMSRRSSAMHSPILEEVIARITQSFSSRSQMTTTNIEASSCDLVEQLRRLFDNDDSKIPDDYWPCAPDGYIPNSVVRQRVPPKEVPAHLIPRLMRGEEAQEWFKKTKKKSSKDDVGMPEDYYYPIALDDDELGFFSIFDGYNEGSYDQEKQSLLLESSDESEDEGLESSDDEMDLKKKWKASIIKTTMNKDQMLSSVRARQSVRDRKKVSKKPEMPMIIAAEEEEDINDVSKAKEAEETESSNGKEEPEDENLQLPLVLRKVIDQPWFPKSSLVEGITVEDIFHEMISMMADCAPLTYGRICDELIGLISCVGMSDEQKTKMLQVVVENLGHPAAGIRRASLKTVQELQVVSNQAIEGIICCLARGSQDLQQDALNALAQLLGVKDKEALRDLFIQINILSRTPSPESDVTPVHRPRTLSSKNIDLLGIEGEDGGMDKNKYIHEWLSGDESAVKTKTAESRSIFKKESREIKMASTIVSKMMFEKPDPRLSIVDLTFHDSSVSSRESSEVEEISSPPMEYTHDLIQKLQRTGFGCKLLSRLGYGWSPADSSKDPIVNFEVPQKIEKIEKNSKIEKRPPGALMGFAYGKVEKPCEHEEGEWGEFNQGYERHRSMGHEQDMGGFPDNNVSRVSSLSKRSGRQQEIQQEMNKTILPKILKRINTNRRNSTWSAVRRRNGRRVSLKQQYRFKLPGFDRKLPEWKTQAGASTQGEQQIDQPLQQQRDISKKGFDGQLPKQKRQMRGPMEGKQQVEQPGEQQDEISNKVQDENSARSGRRLTLDGKETTIDSKRRKSILRGLQRRRLEEELLASQLKNLTNHQQDHDSPLSMTSSLRVPTPSEENLFSPVSKLTNESAAEFHLPRIHLHSKHTETTKISRGVISDGITRGVLPTDTTRIVPGTNVPYSLYTEAETTKISRGLKSDDMTCGVLPTNTTRTVPGTNVPYSLYTEAETTKISRGLKSDDITRGVLSTDTTRTVPGTNVPYSLYTEAETTKISRDVISDDITRGVLSTDTTRTVPGTNVPYSLYTEAETTKTSRDVISDDITRGVLSTDTTRTVPGTNVPYSLYTEAETTKTSRDVISDDITRGVLSTDTNRIIPGTNVLYSLYTEADTTKTSRGAISDDITRGVFSADTTGVVPGTNVPYSLCTDVVGERLSQGTSVIARRPLGDLRMNNEAVRVLRVNPKLTIDTGCNKWGRSRYGVLEVVWTSRGIYDPQDFEISTVIKTRHHQTALNEPTQALCVPTERIAVKKLLKPIRNRNLVANPYTREAQQCFAKKLRKFPSISEGVPSATSSNSGSSRERMEPEHLCTVRELLEFDNRCLSRSN